MQGLKWRVESIRTGRPFAEIVLMHSLLYRVEQVFLIHRETGLVLSPRCGSHGRDARCGHGRGACSLPYSSSRATHSLQKK